MTSAEFDNAAMNGASSGAFGELPRPEMSGLLQSFSGLEASILQALNDGNPDEAERRFVSLDKAADLAAPADMRISMEITVAEVCLAQRRREDALVRLASAREAASRLGLTSLKERAERLWSVDT